MDRSASVSEFIAATEAATTPAFLAAVELSPDELAAVAAGVANLEGPVGEACRTIVNGWGDLDASARVAALLVLANALAGQSRPREHGW